MRSPDDVSRGFAVDNQSGVTVHVRVSPRSSKPGFKSIGPKQLELAVAAAPADGAANDQARKLLAKLLGVAATRVTLIRGRRSRIKSFHIEGMRAADVGERIL